MIPTPVPKGILKHKTADQEGERKKEGHPRNVENVRVKAKHEVNDKGQRIFRTLIWQESQFFYNG